MDPREFYKRIPTALPIQRLWGRRVVVAGLGSGGARVAAELGRLGLDLLLIDRPGERLEEHNIIRHVLGYQSLGKLKLEEVARFVASLNPSTRLVPCEVDVVEDMDRLTGILEQWAPDLIAVCTDNEPSKHALNLIALRLGIPQIGAGVYDGGIGGELYIARPGCACYGCIAGHLHLQTGAFSPQSRPDYSSPSTPEAPSTCALNLDIEQIALLQSRLVFDVLLGPSSALIGLPPETNLCVFANRVVPRTFARPFHCEFYIIHRREGCLSCSVPAGDIEPEADRIVAALKPEL
jgi:hypothetical protein